MKFEYGNSNLYEGEWKNGKPEGQGKMIYQTGMTYEGQWKNGKKNGKGIIIMTCTPPLVVLSQENDPISWYEGE